jgi:hypothetical protein
LKTERRFPFFAFIPPYELNQASLSVLADRILDAGYAVENVGGDLARFRHLR